MTAFVSLLEILRIRVGVEDKHLENFTYSMNVRTLSIRTN